MMSATPLRAIRVPDGLWHAAQRRAAELGESVTAAIVRALEEYARPETERGHRPGG